ncbi:zinc-binding protein A33-like [Protopterus annectens]|uniref:zinc-binding protein A33-like n=1 Tax=Protopterus annectens TaxID=7888 RepID=UPI001CFA1455|nr:zinc-binding protein A33-like [Protopterus annectens]
MARRSQRVKLEYKRQETNFRKKEEMQTMSGTNRITNQCCGEHREKLKLFCQEDEAFICDLCVPRHSNHHFVFLQEAVSLYKDTLKTSLMSLESKVKDCKYLRSKQEKEITGIQEDAFNLEEYFKQTFAKLYQFLYDKEQKLTQQLNSNLEHGQQKPLSLLSVDIALCIQLFPNKEGPKQ